MNERAPSFSLPPRIKTKAGVVERNAIGIQTFAVGSVYGNKLRREVQHLPEFCFLFPDLFLGRLALGDVGHRPDKLTTARCIPYSVSYRVDVLDSPVSQ